MRLADLVGGVGLDLLDLAEVGAIRRFLGVLLAGADDERQHEDQHEEGDQGDDEALDAQAGAVGPLAPRAGRRRRLTWVTSASSSKNDTSTSLRAEKMVGEAGFEPASSCEH